MVTFLSRFDLGRMLATAPVASHVPPEFVAACVARHARGDWGDLDSHDSAMNDAALDSGQDRIFSVYLLPADVAARTGEEKLWVITEWDRSATTVLFPSDY